MSENIIVYIINQSPIYLRIWRQLSNDGKRRVLELCDNDDLMLAENLADVLDEEKESK